VLAADNTALLCGRCHREQRDQLRTPPAQLRNEFFETDEFRAAFESQHIGKVFKAYRNHPRHLQLFGKALNQELLGRWLGLTQAQVSKLENGKPEQNLEALRNYARILHLPQHMLWFDFPGQSRLRSLRPAERGTGAGASSGGLAVPRTQDEILVVNTGMDTLELLRRVRASAINSSTIDALTITVEQLCCDYPHAEARELMKSGKEWLGRVTDLLAKQMTLDQHRDILNNAGMLALLVGCLEYDVGDARSAEATRRMAMELGKDSGDPAIVGWAHEMLAWFHLTAGNYRAALAAAEAGFREAPSQYNSAGSKRKLTHAWEWPKRFIRLSKRAVRCWTSCPIRTDRSIISSLIPINGTSTQWTPTVSLVQTNLRSATLKRSSDAVSIPKACLWPRCAPPKHS
jgi:hypothetical protein